MREAIIVNSGNKIPVLAFGTAAPHLGKDCSKTVLLALRKGIRHIDTAQLYCNEEYVGKALKMWGGDREEVYITAKWGCQGDALNDPRKALEDSLRNLKLDYVDMFLMHSPITIKPYTIAEAWRIMEALQAEGKCVDIGVSNFGHLDILELSKSWKVVPAVNQIEFSPYNAHDPRCKSAIEICQENDIVIFRFGCLQPLSLHDPPLPLNPVIQRIAEENALTVGQVLLKWAMHEMEGPVVTTTDKPHRIDEYIQAFQKPALSEQDLKDTREAGKGRYFRRYLDPFRP
ncbi:uncharacterized protein L199_002751 [Kwoniella botswanensis]|uniref:uncharacterized protein n=1 Tax=Kwoniella botswanensis TaxID=1268659 RepID=UPI00315C9E44